MASTVDNATLSFPTDNTNDAATNAFPRVYRFSVSPDGVRTFKDPHNPDLQIYHVYIPIREFAHGLLPDDVNPRSHDDPGGRIATLIETTAKTNPKWLHLLNRGELILAQRCSYDNKSHHLSFVINSREEGGVADGATTDRVLARLKREVAEDLASVPDDLLPAFLKEAYVHLEIIAGPIGEMLVPLTGARNTSNQVKEFALENLGGRFNWLKDIIESSEFKGQVKYRENDPEPVDIRTILGLLTLFHPRWNELHKEPVVAFTSKGQVLEYFRTDLWKPGYEMLKPVVLDILRLSEFIQTEFPAQYSKHKEDAGKIGRLGGRKEVRYNKGKTFKLPLSQAEVEYGIPDGWLYPVLGAFRQLLGFPKDEKGKVKWITDAQTFFTQHGHELVANVVEQSWELGSNPGATGKSKTLWEALRNRMELYRLKMEQSERDA